MAWPTDITAADRGRTLEVVFDDGETVRLTAERLGSNSERRGLRSFAEREAEGRRQENGCRAF